MQDKDVIDLTQDEQDQKSSKRSRDDEEVIIIATKPGVKRKPMPLARETDPVMMDEPIDLTQESSPWSGTCCFGFIESIIINIQSGLIASRFAAGETEIPLALLPQPTEVHGVFSFRMIDNNGKEVLVSLANL